MTLNEPKFLPDEFRTATEVAQRALALFAVVGLALHADRHQLLQWLSNNDLWQELSPRERGFVDAVEPSRKQVINASWQSECLIVLLWALDLIDELPPADQECDANVFLAVMPPFVDTTLCGFLARARLRDADELLAMQEVCLDLHWHARDGRIHARPPRKPVNVEIIQERHRAINWICGYDGGALWDDVTTDT